MRKRGIVTDGGEFIKFPDGTWIDLDPTQGCAPAFNLKVGEEVEVIIRRKVSPSVLPMENICEKCKTCARHTNLKGYGVCYSDKQEPCNRFVTEEELEAEVQREYNDLGRYTGD